jgi:hypothetical protein
MAKTRCPRCGVIAECFCREGGHDGGFDEFILRCLSCGHRVAERKMIGSPDTLFGSFSEEYPSCPFCGGRCNQHQKPPAEAK